MDSDDMRRLINLVEGEVINLPPGHRRPVDKIAALRGAEIHRLVPRPNLDNLDDFTRAYMVAALWASNDEDGEPLDSSYDLEDLAPETATEMAEDCADFQRNHGDLIAEAGIDDEQAGHDFWLTRNGHGAGFWDRDLGAIGDQLAEKARAYGGYHLYVGDDGRIYGG